MAPARVAWTAVAGWLRPAVDAIAPPRCCGCRAVWAGGLCPGCVEVLDRSPMPSPRPRAHGVVLAAFHFEGRPRTVLHEGKYGRRQGPIGELAGLAAARLAPLVVARRPVVIPVPLGARRRRYRGFNQAEVWGVTLARAAGLDVDGGLARIRETPPQVGRDAASRRRNCAGAFTWRGPSLDGTRVCLADDVITTGSTVAACCSALVAAGAARVDVAVIAAAGRGVGLASESPPYNRRR